MFASTPERAARAAELAVAIRPTAAPSSRLVPVAEPLADLLPDGGLRRGSTLVVAGPPGYGTTSLGLALLSAASAAGHWCGAVGLDDPGVVAMAELGIDLRRVVFVPRPRGAWAAATAELFEGVDVVLVRPPARVAHTAARRLHSRARDRGVVLVALVEHRDDWPVPATTTLEVLEASWSADGGRLVGRRGVVRTTGHSTPRPRRTLLWLPDPRGAVATAS
jgi:hypothetical protein